LSLAFWKKINCYCSHDNDKKVRVKSRKSFIIAKSGRRRVVHHDVTRRCWMMNTWENVRTCVFIGQIQLMSARL
jgi:hypothetical protein